MSVIKQPFYINARLAKFAISDNMSFVKFSSHRIHGIYSMDKKFFFRQIIKNAIELVLIMRRTKLTIKKLVIPKNICRNIGNEIRMNEFCWFRISTEFLETS